MYARVFSFISKVVQKEKEATRLVESSNNQVMFRDDIFIFTLKGLYELLFGEESEEGEGYPGFRAMLYSSRLNSDLLKLGYKVEIYTSTQKVDTSWYQIDLKGLGV